MLWLILSGCGGGLSTDYGESKGYSAKRSLNGFTTLRSAFSDAGFYDREFNRLTDRSRRAAVVVWTPRHPSPIETRTTRWFEQWLSAGNKTLIYVLPDSGSESSFYHDARPVANPEQRLEYRRKYAESLIAEHQWQLQRSSIPSNGWFAARPKIQRSKVEVAEDAKSVGHEWTVPAEQDRQRRFEWVLEPYDSSNQAPQTTTFSQPVGPGSPPMTFIESVSPTSTPIEFTPILKSDDGDTLVAKVSSDRWTNSQILVVAGGSLLTNYGLTHRENQQLADELIEASFQPVISGNIIDPDTRLLADGSAPQVGFTSVNGAIPISERVGDIPRASGAELLTVFPISFVTFHLAILGFVICLMLLPVFGRPRQVDRGVLTHFGDHLSAVATLMRRRGGEAYAKRRISEYMKKVRDESSGPWVIESPPHLDNPATHLHVPGTMPKIGKPEIALSSEPSKEPSADIDRVDAESFTANGADEPIDKQIESIDFKTDDFKPTDRG